MRKKLLLVNVLLFVIAWAGLAEEESVKYIDETEYNAWLRTQVVDPFDDTEIGRTVLYITEDGEILSIIRRKDEKSCTTIIGVAFPSSRLSTSQSMKRREAATSALLDDTVKIAPIDTSFNVKRTDKDDLKFMNLPFVDIGTDNLYSDTISLSYPSLSLKTHPKRKQILSAFLESYEVRVKAETYGYVFNLKVSMDKFKEKWDWAADLCNDEYSDPENEEEAEVVEEDTDQ